MFQKFIGLVAGLALIGANTPVARAAGLELLKPEAAQALVEISSKLAQAGKVAKATSDAQGLLTSLGASATTVQKLAAIVNGAGTVVAKSGQVVELFNGQLKTVSQVVRDQGIKEFNALIDACSKAMKHTDAETIMRSYGQYSSNLRGVGQFRTQTNSTATGSYNQVVQTTGGAYTAGELAVLQRTQALRAAGKITEAVAQAVKGSIESERINLIGEGMNSDVCSKLSETAIITFLKTTGQYGKRGFMGMAAEYAQIMGVTMETAQRNICMLASTTQGCKYWGKAVTNQCGRLGINL